MDWPQTWRQGTQLYAFHTATFYERDGILKVVMSILRAVGCEDSALAALVRRRRPR